MITLHWLYTLAGAMFAAFAFLSALDRSNKKRLGNAAFWGLMALSLLGGDVIGDFGNGLLVLGLAGLAGVGFIGRSDPPTTSEAAGPGRAGEAGDRLVRACAGVAGFGFIGRSRPPTTSEAERQAWSDKLGNRLFLPALIIPIT